MVDESGRCKLLAIHSTELLWKVTLQYSRSDGSSGSGGQSPSTTSHDLVACLALPDADVCALDGVLAAERAGVARVLRDFDLLDGSSQGGT